MDNYDALLKWALENRTYPIVDPDFGPVDYHRLQLEYWLWANRSLMRGLVIDVGGEFKRPFIDNLLLVNLQDYLLEYTEMQSDIHASLTHLPFTDNSIGTVICTETLEHVPLLFQAVDEIKRVIRPGGYAFVTTPFFWPTHNGGNFNDYWRLTFQAYEFLFHDFDGVVIGTHMKPTTEEVMLKVAENETFNEDGEHPTGYLYLGRKR